MVVHKIQQQGMLLVLPVPFQMHNGQLLFEAQACNGLERWADNFGNVIVAAPVMPKSIAEHDRTIVWKNTAMLDNPQRFEFVLLPWAYSLRDFFAHYRSTRTLLAKLIHRSEYLQFAISSLWGDWAAIAALEAKKQNRPYAIHTDVVDYRVILQINQDKSLPKRLKARVLSSLMQQYHQWIIRNCSLGLWHGNDCYQAYSPFCKNSHLIHDVHTKSEDGITPAQLKAKLEQCQTNAPLRICYAGRMVDMKAPLDWIRAIAHAQQLGAPLEATWYGEGPLRPAMEQLIAELGLQNVVHLAGFERDRQALLQKIREAHVMLFTHITPESPRCLIESLICGTPIIGYHSAYPEDLLRGKGGGCLVPKQDWQQLGKTLHDLAMHRPRLVQLIQQAAANGEQYSDEFVFQERSRLITTHLSRPNHYSLMQELLRV
ncbi:glycosyltransferase [Thermocoleostomius sinensis]|uniref:Glycosyltransferase n=1 Tax=Thermocoleostomius sinensis A174 TaxID=2016057 RepID=A0A9E8Z8Q4_9CYAN|nr:glycosyltransferase [Thermocoleostomius sinensis]WAL58372.1 glycosyltransferase [Thermocoleostomius sinensis A174]